MLLHMRRDALHQRIAGKEDFIGLGQRKLVKQGFFRDGDFFLRQPDFLQLDFSGEFGFKFRRKRLIGIKAVHQQAILFLNGGFGHAMRSI